MQAERCISRAQALVGTPFRLHGRDPAFGLDCVGLVALASDRLADAPLGYSLRSGDPSRWISLLNQLGRRRRGQLQPGDALLLDAGPGQIHCGLWTGDGLIHADAGLHRVVETPGPPRWPLLGAWALCEQD